MKTKALLAIWLALILVGVAFADGIEDLHRDILYPTVRVRTNNGVGSGVIFASIKNGDRYDTYCLTNHHVIEDAINISSSWDSITKEEKKKETRATVEIELFKYLNWSKASGTLLVLSDIQEWSKEHDLALIKLRSDEKIEPVKLFPASNVDKLRIFMPVIVCGSGLGRSPFPTSGFLASLTDEIENQPYWMVSAPSVFGNSGGGTFLSDTREYIGIPSRLAVTFATWAPNAVYHMSYIIPISRIYSWLGETGWKSLFDPTVCSHEEWLKDKKYEKNTAK